MTLQHAGRGVAPHATMERHGHTFRSSARHFWVVISSLSVMTLRSGLMPTMSTPTMVDDKGMYLEHTCSLAHAEDRGEAARGQRKSFLFNKTESGGDVRVAPSTWCCA